MDNSSFSLKATVADARLRRIFGITLVDYYALLASQGGVCKICGRPPKKIRLAVDHDHRFDRIKILTQKTANYGGYATAKSLCGRIVSAYGKTRAEAKKAVHLILRRISIRGLLCTNCNRGLQKFYDKPERFEAAASYLRAFERRINNEKVSDNSTSSITSIAPNL